MITSRNRPHEANVYHQHRQSKFQMKLYRVFRENIIIARQCAAPIITISARPGRSSCETLNLSLAINIARPQVPVVWDVEGIQFSEKVFVIILGFL